MRHYYHYAKPFSLETGGVLPELTIAYDTYGNLNVAKSNVIWICHALTASSAVVEWWDGLVGPQKVIDTNKYFVVCANILGSCYGTTGPTSLNPVTNQPYGNTFPFFTIRDMVAAHQLLQQYLKLPSIYLLAGGSMGGYQVLEWANNDPSAIQNLFLIATAAEESAWGKAIHATQRMAITADPDWACGIQGRGDAGLKAARGIGMLTYRNYDIFKAQQEDKNAAIIEDHKAAQYIAYQGQKLADRFDALTYYKLTVAMDTHQLARGKEQNLENVLKNIKQPALVMGISSDNLCPPAEQLFLAKHLGNATYHEIDSQYGHDGFLIEHEQIGNLLKNWME